MTRTDGAKIKAFPPYAILPDGSVRPDERCWQTTMDTAAKVGPDVAKVIADTIVRASQAQAQSIEK